MKALATAALLVASAVTAAHAAVVVTPRAKSLTPSDLHHRGFGYLRFSILTTRGAIAWGPRWRQQKPGDIAATTSCRCGNGRNGASASTRLVPIFPFWRAPR